MQSKKSKKNMIHCRLSSFPDFVPSKEREKKSLAVNDFTVQEPRCSSTIPGRRDGGFDRLGCWLIEYRLPGPVQLVRRGIENELSPCGLSKDLKEGEGEQPLFRREALDVNQVPAAGLGQFRQIYGEGAGVLVVGGDGQGTLVGEDPQQFPALWDVEGERSGLWLKGVGDRGLWFRLGGGLIDH